MSVVDVPVIPVPAVVDVAVPVGGDVVAVAVPPAEGWKANLELMLQNRGISTPEAKLITLLVLSIPGIPALAVLLYPIISQVTTQVPWVYLLASFLATLISCLILFVVACYELCAAIIQWPTFTFGKIRFACAVLFVAAAVSYDTSHSLVQTQMQELVQTQMQAVTELQTQMQELVQIVEDQKTKMHPLPVGTIAMWSGKVVDIPKGWVHCDGSQKCPDLRGRFIRGCQFVQGEPEACAVGMTGGGDPSSPTAFTHQSGNHGHTGHAGNHTLTIRQLPDHTHTHANLNMRSSDGRRRGTHGLFADGTGSTTTGGTGGGEAHTHPIPEDGTHSHELPLPGYHTLAFIMFRGV